MSDQLAALRLFVRVARTGSFSRAAREERIAQPTASRVIAALEQDLGVALFTRTTRALTLTEAGTDYLARIEPLLRSLDEAAHAVRGTGELRGVLRVGLSSSFAVRAVIPLLPGFTERHPALHLELMMEDGRQDIVAEGLDIVLRFGELPDSSAVARRIGTWPRVVAAAPSYLARAGTPRVPADLAGHAAVVARGGFASWTFRRDGEDVTVRAESRLLASQNEGVIAAGVAGLGVVTTTSAANGRELAAGTLVRLLPDWDLGSVDLHALFPARHAATPAARAFADFLVDALREFGECNEKPPGLASISSID